MQERVHNGVAEDRVTGAIAASAILKSMGKDEWALFVGQWPAAFLLMGVYNKMVKQHGSDVYSKAA